MKNTRREFLQQLLAVSASIPLFNTAVMADAMENPLDGDNSRSTAIDECVEVYRIWRSTENIDPVSYLIDVLGRYNLAPNKISSAAKLDFQYKNFFDVNGLQLSKTEAAFLAHIGERHHT